MPLARQRPARSHRPVPPVRPRLTGGSLPCHRAPAARRAGRSRRPLLASAGQPCGRKRCERICKRTLRRRPAPGSVAVQPAAR
eukprot:5680968-Alexandrium_andersonii.AAC.1